MTTQTPTRKGRSIAMAAATALFTTTLAAPALMANAAEAALTVAAPTTSDVAAWKSDSFTVVQVDGIKWSYKVGSAAAIDIADSALTVKPFAKAATQPESGSVTVIATPADVTDKVNGGDAGVANEFPLTFKTYTESVVTPKSPTVKRDNKTGLDVVTVPFVKGLDWMVKEGTGAAAKYVFGGAKAEVYNSDTNKPTKLTFTASVDADKGFSLGKDGTVVLAEVVIDPLKSQAKVIDKPGEVADVQDLPGVAKDHVVLDYQEGVIWVANGKDIKLKAGKTAIVKRAKNSKTVDITYKAATGYRFETDVATTDKISIDFDDVSFAPQDVTVANGTASAKPSVTITPSAVATVKTWSFTPSATGAKEIKFALPKGMTTVKFNLPGAGTLKAVPVAGYKLVNRNAQGTGVVAVDNSITWAVAVAS